MRIVCALVSVLVVLCASGTKGNPEDESAIRKVLAETTAADFVQAALLNARLIFGWSGGWHSSPPVRDITCRCLGAATTAIRPACLQTWMCIAPSGHATAVTDTSAIWVRRSIEKWRCRLSFSRNSNRICSMCCGTRTPLAAGRIT